MLVANLYQIMHGRKVRVGVYASASREGLQARLRALYGPQTSRPDSTLLSAYEDVWPHPDASVERWHYFGGDPVALIVEAHPDASFALHAKFDHYHVNVGTRGYVPDNCDSYATRADAESGAKWWASVMREDFSESAYHLNLPADEIERLSGSARSGWYESSAPGYRIPRYIEIVGCSECECRQYDGRFLEV
jgi:hypothetical protein